MNKLFFRGKSKYLNSNIIGTAKILKSQNNQFLIILVDNNSSIDSGAYNPLAIITSDPEFEFPDVPLIYLSEDISFISDGDILNIDRIGNIRILYKSSSLSNSLFVTEQCNSRCIMCSQPPRNVDDIKNLLDINQRLIELIPHDCKQLGITGGEPTLLGDDLFNLLKLINFKLPDTELHILTNARLFSNIEYAKLLLELDTSKIVWGVPIYSDYFELHDLIVNSKNAFYQTILGLHNLARFNQRIEIRTVLISRVIPRLPNLARFIYKNLTFVEHVAFMGLENVGFAKNNLNSLWINPSEYYLQLREAINFLNKNNLNTSIYNIPLCLLPVDLWKFAKQSISEWKNIFLHQCGSCIVKNECAGLFQTNLEKMEELIKPII